MAREALCGLLGGSGGLGGVRGRLALLAGHRGPRGLEGDLPQPRANRHPVSSGTGEQLSALGVGGPHRVHMGPALGDATRDGLAHAHTVANALSDTLDTPQGLLRAGATGRLSAFDKRLRGDDLTGDYEQKETDREDR